VRERVARALFVNTGILGHRTVAGLMQETTAHLSRVEASHLDLSRELIWSDRAVRRVFSLRLAPARGSVANIDLRRWREELNVGLLAGRRIARLERRSGPFALLHFHTQAAAYGSLRRMRRTPSIVSIDARSRSPAIGVVFQEAAAAGLPAVATRINAVPEIIADGETGLLVPPADPEALVVAMRTLIDSIDLRLAMGRAARARIRTATPAAYANRLQAIIGSLLDTHDVHAA
jgi:hypothetical protein